MDQINLQKWDDANLVPLITQRKEAVWIIVYGLDKFYLTNEEKEYLLNSLEKGAKFVQIKGNVLTDKFLYITVDDVIYNELKKDANNSKFDGLGKSVPLSPEEEKKRNEAREKLRSILKEKGVLNE
jgi:hypothetical protein